MSKNFISDGAFGFNSTTRIILILGIIGIIAFMRNKGKDA